VSPGLDRYRRLLAETPPEQGARVARARRFHQRWQADPAFRQAVEEDPGGEPEVAGPWRLGFAAEEVRPLWDAGLQAELPTVADWAPWPRALEWARFAAALELHRVSLRGHALSACSEPRLAAWRRRQHARCEAELGAAGRAVLQAPVAWELSRGCSVGCWFCGLDAPRLRDHLPHDGPGRDLWRGCLEVALDLVGPSAQTGFCYWATDPFDNPDYVAFAADHAAVTGRMPQATTALALRDPARTRGLLALSARHGSGPERFSIVRRGDLEALHTVFSPEELLGVEVILHNPGALTPKAMAGRARHVALERSRKGRARPLAPEELDHPTIACVSGFLVNLVARTVELISPCRADSDHPLGYRVHARAGFEDATTFRSALERCIADGTQDELPGHGARGDRDGSWRENAIRGEQAHAG